MADRVGGQFTSASASESLGWGVGRISFLNSTASLVSKYWRSIEYGNPTVGNYIGGLWTSSFKSQGDRGSLIGNNDYSFFGGSDQQKFVPFGAPMRSEADAAAGARAALYFLFSHGFFGAKKDPRQGLYFVYLKRLKDGDYNVPTMGKISEQPPGVEAYKKVLETFNPAAEEKAVIADIFTGMGFTLGQRRRQRSAITGEQLSRRLGGLLTVRVTSGYNRSLLSVDKQFQSELIAANRKLAFAFAEKVAAQYDEPKRGPVSTGALQDATLNPENRFPS